MIEFMMIAVAVVSTLVSYRIWSIHDYDKGYHETVESEENRYDDD